MRRARPAVVREDRSKDGALDVDGVADPEPRRALPSKVGPAAELFGRHTPGARQTACGCQVVVPAGCGDHLPGSRPSGTPSGMPEDSGNCTAQARRVSRRKTRPPDPGAVVLDRALQPDVLLVSGAAAGKAIQSVEVPAEPSRFPPRRIETAHVHGVAGAAGRLQFADQRRPLPQPAAERVLHHHRDAAKASSAKQPDQGGTAGFCTRWAACVGFRH